MEQFPDLKWLEIHFQTFGAYDEKEAVLPCSVLVDGVLNNILVDDLVL